MKSKRNLIMTACAALILSSVPVSAGAAGTDYIYGTMEIPYADFYRAELAGSSNAYDVDAVSSATSGKWAMNEEGKLCEGTFNKANEDGQGGQILGVVYPVAVKAEDLKALGDNNYSFTEISGTPEAYKVVSVENGSAVFSEVKDEKPEKLGGQATITANTAWGDYLVNVSDKPEDMGAIYGAVIKTNDGRSYGMRHLENIWRGELAWSSGVKVTEPHGNALSYENFKDIMGATISEVTYITKKGYYTAETSLYVPVKFEGTLTAEDTKLSSGKTTVKTEGFPSDYKAEYSVENLETTVSGNTVNFKNALPGSYTVTAKDTSGKYADVSASFIISTDKIPAVYENGKVVKSSDATDEEYTNFIKRISSVKIGENEYSLGGKRGVKILLEDGTVDMNAVSGETKIFEGSDSYKVSFTATGYEKTLDFTVNTKEAEVTTTAAASSKPAETTAGSKSSNSGSAQNVSSTPKTGDSVHALPVTLAMVVAGAVAVSSRKKKK